MGPDLERLVARHGDQFQIRLSDFGVAGIGTRRDTQRRVHLSSS
jgi:hypothetical protein